MCVDGCCAAHGVGAIRGGCEGTALKNTFDDKFRLSIDCGLLGELGGFFSGMHGSIHGGALRNGHHYGRFLCCTKEGFTEISSFSLLLFYWRHLLQYFSFVISATVLFSFLPFQISFLLDTWQGRLVLGLVVRISFSWSLFFLFFGEGGFSFGWACGMDWVGYEIMFTFCLLFFSILCI